MARRLVAAEHELNAYDVDASRAEALGVGASATLAEAVADCDVAITSLPTPETVAVVVRELGEAARAGTTVIEMSTSPPSLEQRLAAELEARGVDFLDAPVSGGPTGAEQGTLAIMVGGSAGVFDRWAGLLGSLGSLVRHVGPAGSGQVVKLCNNLVVATEMVAISEACGILEREGIDPTVAYELLTSSTSDSSVLRRRFPIGGVRPEHPSSDGFAPMFTLDLLTKDLLLALVLADECGIDVPISRRALGAYEEAQTAGLGALDYSAVYRAVAPKDR